MVAWISLALIALLTRRSAREVICNMLIIRAKRKADEEEGEDEEEEQEEEERDGESSKGQCVHHVIDLAESMEMDSEDFEGQIIVV